MKQKQGKIDLHLDDVEMMTDSAIVAKLIRYGENPGPITDTTRLTYMRRLAVLMEEPRPRRE